MNTMQEDIKSMIVNSVKVKNSVVNQLTEKIEESAKLILETLRNGNKIILAGNGGSASQATHIAAEYTGRFRIERKSLPAISLTTDTSALTALGNDYGFEKIFERQIEGIGNKGDVFIAISTSGNSINLVNSMTKAREMGINVIGIGL